jgi:hypothetical protein
VEVITVTRSGLLVIDTTGWESLTVFGRRRVARLRAMDCVPMFGQMKFLEGYKLNEYTFSEPQILSSMLLI